ncbi:hypothetical protein GCM10007859_00820 [Brevundimonas denitrificans]|uniref:Nicotinamide riboside transporter PnuC n=1 Tax=Brevundimonas denitrificans TaxID=1443434 RepID=A0ABQ6BFB8_9CAUL|nr:hypothetical protein [Brevundimonas denitrificans]GLS00079.1 hypothetical protein GCM10007859_00820 [Brevundimonas denitrificans]
MFDTLQTQIGAAITVVVIAFAFLKGDEPERVGGGAYVLAWFASLLMQDDGGGGGVSWGLTATDIVLLCVYAALAWKSRRAWPVWASGLQSLIVMSHLLTFVDIRPPLMAFYAVINVSSYGILLVIAIGTFQAWRERQAAGLE